MSLLSQLLQRALVNRPSQVIIEADRPVVIEGEQGTRRHGKAMAGEDVFNALFEVLSEEQQAELVVGKAVGFQFATGPRIWEIETRTARHEMSVCARLLPRIVEVVEVEGLEDDAVLSVAGKPIREDSEPASDEEFDVDFGDTDSGLLSVERTERTHAGLAGHAGARGRRERERLLAAVPPGSLCFSASGVQNIRSLIDELGIQCMLIQDPDEPRRLWKLIRQLPPESALILDCDDPSRFLGLLLRRLEEGHRVVVNTQARTIEGARRILLGVNATVR
ncbi:MAG: hypothetical protein ACPG77_10165, partial [Nannocystaceae bacterium]